MNQIDLPASYSYNYKVHYASTYTQSLTLDTAHCSPALNNCSIQCKNDGIANYVHIILSIMGLMGYFFDHCSKA